MSLLSSSDKFYNVYDIIRCESNNIKFNNKPKKILLELYNKIDNIIKPLLPPDYKYIRGSIMRKSKKGYRKLKSNETFDRKLSTIIPFTEEFMLDHEDNIDLSLQAEMTTRSSSFLEKAKGDRDWYNTVNKSVGDEFINWLKNYDHETLPTEFRMLEPHHLAYDYINKIMYGMNITKKQILFLISQYDKLELSLVRLILYPQVKDLIYEILNECNN